MSVFWTIFPVRRFWLLVILVLITALTLVACNTKRLQTAATQVPQLITSIDRDPDTFNPALSQVGINIFGLTFEGLTTDNPVTGEIEPALAQYWQISDDKLRIVFTLRSGLKWSDGQSLTADDVVFTYNDIYLNEAIPTGIRDSLRIGEDGALPKVRKLDERRVEFSLPEPFFPFLRSTTAEILPTHTLAASVKTLDKQGKPLFLTKWGTDTPPDQLIVSGPYQLERYDTSQRLIFRRNPYYWRKNAQGNPSSNIERIVWQILESTDTALLQFRSGGLDSVMVSPEHFSLLKQQEHQGNYKIYNGGSSTAPPFIVFNLNKGRRDGKLLVDPVKSRWFNTLEFRQAVAYAINRQRILNNTFHGLGELENSPISVHSPYYLSPQAGLKVYNYNPQRAKELLLKAGFKYNKNQLVDALGNRVRFTLTTGTESKNWDTIGAQIKQDLSKIGIQVDFVRLATNALLEKLFSSTWEASLGAFANNGSLEPNNDVCAWLNPAGTGAFFNQKSLPGQQPFEGWDVADWEAEIGRLCTQGAREFDETKRKAIYAKIQRISQEYLPFIYLVNHLEMMAVRDRFAGIKFSALTFDRFWNIYEIKVKQ